ncbi:MAG: serine hydrolase [Bacteroidales bacterium]|nr:serine hydrolase [Bacteroidales bacterium]
MEITRKSQKYIQLFVQLMQQKVSDIGLQNTTVVCPCGLSYENTSTAKDIVTLLLNAAQYPDICRLWGKLHACVKYGRRARLESLDIQSTVFSSSYGEYNLLGGKTGSDGDIFNLATIIELEGDLYACVVLNAKSEKIRTNAIVSLMNYVKGVESFSVLKGVSSAIVCKLMPSSLYGKGSLTYDIIFAQNEKEVVPMLSITKLVTAMTALDVVKNLQECISISTNDLQRGSGAFFIDGDVLTYEDAFVVMLLPSSNTASFCIARNIGKIKYQEWREKSRLTLKILWRKSKNLFLKSFYYNLYLHLLVKYDLPNLAWEKTKIRYRNVTDKDLDYKHPKDLNEKLLWLTRYWKHPIKTQCADKFVVREYVKKKGLEHILVPLLGVWDSEKQIDFDRLPNQFVLKCNHGCGFNIICITKENFDKKIALEKISNWMQIDFGRIAYEVHYSGIPRKIICEQLLDAKEAPMEYQIWCINGKADSVLACRKNWNGSYDSWSYSLDWKRLYDRIKETEDECPKPKNLSEIIHYSEILSENIPFVRMDFYEVNEKVYFAEMTFTPAANILTSYKASFVNRLGKQLILPKKYR